MSVGKEVLSFLDEQLNISVKNTGWKSGVSLDVAIWLPIIQSEHFLAEVTTDGDQFLIRRNLGSKREFNAMIEEIVTHFGSH